MYCTIVTVSAQCCGEFAPAPQLAHLVHKLRRWYSTTSVCRAENRFYGDFVPAWSPLCGLASGSFPSAGSLFLPETSLRALFRVDGQTDSRQRASKTPATRATKGNAERTTSSKKRSVDRARTNSSTNSVMVRLRSQASLSLNLSEQTPTTQVLYVPRFLARVRRVLLWYNALYRSILGFRKN